MFRRYWQNAMIGLARSKFLTNYMQSTKASSLLARKFVGGSCPHEAIITAKKLSQQGIYSSLFYLGEYAETEQLVAENVKAKQDIAPFLAEAALDIHISVDPTQLGCSIDWGLGTGNITDLTQKITKLAPSYPGFHAVMLDMEDYSVNEKTISLYNKLHKEGLKSALTLQAYLRKTAQDIGHQIQQGGKVRLVKGAFAAGPDIAFTSHREIKDNYIHLIDIMLSKEARQTGFYPIFATHDHILHDYAIARARANDWPSGSYEFEMLYGARDSLAQDLARRGEKIRLYLPFGKDWWPYAIRRIGENPRSIALLIRSLFSR